MTSTSECRLAVVLPMLDGIGGLGYHSQTVIQAIVRFAGTHIVGRAPSRWVKEVTDHDALTWHFIRQPVNFFQRLRFRVRPGAAQDSFDRALQRSILRILQRIRPSLLYTFTQISGVCLDWARDCGVNSILDSPTGHIRALWERLNDESHKWLRRPFQGYPTPNTVIRVEREYGLANRIRVASEFARNSLLAGGVSSDKVCVTGIPIDLARFCPPARRDDYRGPLRIVYVGSVNLGKGVIYLLRALRKFGAQVRLQIVGSTGDRTFRRFFERESRGLDLAMAPGDPLPIYQNSDLLILPSLHDGFGLVVAEAMACGLPVVATWACGASEWIQQGRTGLIVPPASIEALQQAITEALARRYDLEAMGRAARNSVEQRGGPQLLDALAHDIHLAVADSDRC